jgi:glutathione S-transferase
MLADGDPAMSDSNLTLWHLPVSHYSEKARWALDHKGVDHRRRAPLPGSHMVFALALTRGKQKTFPVIQLDGRTIGDSTAVIAAIEERYPEPPLYPADPELRRRALELEDFFDEELGPYARHAVFYELINDPATFGEVAARAVPGPLGRSERLVGTYARIYTSLRFGANSSDGAVEARAKVIAAFDRLEAELEANGGDYLVGDEFSVADLTAASLFYPVVGPEGGPVPHDQALPPAFDEFREPLRQRPGYLWVEETYRRHRGPDRQPAAAAG